VERRRPGATRRPRSGRRSMATSRGWRSDARAVAESVLLRRETNRDVRVGSIFGSGPPTPSCPLYPDERTSPGPSVGSEKVESRMGAVAWAIRQRSVSHPRSSNRTCRSPASGSPTGFTARYTESKLTARGFGTVITRLRPATQQSPAAPVIDGVCRLIANHHDLAIFESAPEVRALCSAGITRPQSSYDPVRLPP
jgi:hypothetical protein